MKYIAIAVASAIAVAVIGAAFLLYPTPDNPAPVAKPKKARTWSTAKLETQLSPKDGTYTQGTHLVIPQGWVCDQFTRRPRDVVFVCKPARGPSL